jgi:hypothetical protein
MEHNNMFREEAEEESNRKWEKVKENWKLLKSNSNNIKNKQETRENTTIK